MKCEAKEEEEHVEINRGMKKKVKRKSKRKGRKKKTKERIKIIKNGGGEKLKSHLS